MRIKQREYKYIVTEYKPVEEVPSKNLQTSADTLFWNCYFTKSHNAQFFFTDREAEEFIEEKLKANPANKYVIAEIQCTIEAETPKLIKERI